MASAAGLPSSPSVSVCPSPVFKAASQLCALTKTILSPSLSLLTPYSVSQLSPPPRLQLPI